MADGRLRDTRLEEKEDLQALNERFESYGPFSDDPPRELPTPSCQALLRAGGHCVGSGGVAWGAHRRTNVSLTPTRRARSHAHAGPAHGTGDGEGRGSTSGSAVEGAGGGVRGLLRDVAASPTAVCHIPRSLPCSHRLAKLRVLVTGMKTDLATAAEARANWDRLHKEKLEQVRPRSHHSPPRR